MGCEQSVPVDNKDYTNTNQTSSTYTASTTNQGYSYYPPPQTNAYYPPQTNAYYPNQSNAYYPNQSNAYYPNQTSYPNQVAQNYYYPQNTTIKYSQEDPVNVSSNPQPSAPPEYKVSTPAYQVVVPGYQQKVIQPQYYVYQGAQNVNPSINQVYYIPSNNLNTVKTSKII